MVWYKTNAELKSEMYGKSFDELRQMNKKGYNKQNLIDIIDKYEEKYYEMKRKFDHMEFYTKNMESKMDEWTKKHQDIITMDDHLKKTNELMRTIENKKEEYNALRTKYDCLLKEKEEIEEKLKNIDKKVENYKEMEYQILYLKGLLAFATGRVNPKIDKIDLKTNAGIMDKQILIEQH